LPAITGLFNFIEQFLGEKIVARGELDKGWLSVYSREGLMADVGKRVADQIERDDRAARYWMSMVHERGKRLVSFANSIPSPDGLSLKNIFVLVRECFRLYEDSTSPLWHSFHAAEAAGGAVLQMLNAREVKNEAGLMLQLSQPSKKAHVMKITDYIPSVGYRYIIYSIEP